MANEASFFRAIEDDPDDLSHSLVYADWLADQGDDDRAEFVRVGCAMAKLDPEWDVEHVLLAARRDRLHNKHYEDEDGWGRWNGEYHYHGCIRMPRHGVPYAVRVMKMDTFLHENRAALAPPFAALSVYFERDDDDGRLFALPRMAQVRELFVDHLHDRSAAALLRARRLGRLRKLTVYWPQMGWEMQDRLFRSPMLDRLTDLSIAYVSFEQNDYLGRPRPANLRRLSIRQTTLTTGETEMLASAEWSGLKGLHLDEVQQLGYLRDHVASEHLHSLESLSVRDNERFGLDGAVTVLRNLALVNLRDLCLPKLDDRGDQAELIDALARLDLPALRHLDLGKNRLGAQALEALGRSPSASRLVGLKLGGCSELKDAGAVALAKGDFRSLRRLELGSIGLGVRGLKALLAAPWMRGVAWLDLSNNKLKASAARWLAESPNVVGLRVLNLSGNGLGDEGATRLVRSDNLAQLQALYLNDTKLTDATIPAMMRAPMLENLVVLLMNENGGLSREAPLALGASGRCKSLQSIRWPWEGVWFDDEAIARVNGAFGPGCYRFREEEVMLEQDDPAFWW